MSSRTTMEDASAPTVTFTLPGGYVLNTSDGPVLLNEATVHELTGAEEDILADESLSEARKMQDLVGSCLVKLSNGGDVAIVDEKKLMNAPDRLLLSDIVAMVFRIREATAGTEYRQRVVCPKCKEKGFREPYKWTAILNMSEFESLPMDGDPLVRSREYTTSRGKKIEWELLTGAGQMRVEVLSRGTKDEATLALMGRVRKVNGEEATVESLKRMSAVERMEIRKQFDGEGGIETDFDCECKQCKSEFKQTIEIGGADFFFPSETSED